MKAVNLVPREARRSRGGVKPGAGGISVDSVGPAHFVIGALVIAIALLLLGVLAQNTANDKKATLAALRAQVLTEQAEAAKFATYTGFVQAAQQRETQVREVAEQRFPWERTLNQISRVMPATTYLSSLSATTASTTSTTGTTSVAGPTITLAGCTATQNMNGVATLLRRLRYLSGVESVGFQNAAREHDCQSDSTDGSSFSLTLGFNAPSTAAGGA